MSGVYISAETVGREFARLVVTNDLEGLDFADLSRIYNAMQMAISEGGLKWIPLNMKPMDNQLMNVGKNQCP